MLLQILQTAINYHHICHPFTQNTEKKLSCCEMVMGIALLILGSVFTYGGFAVFALSTAYWKHKKIRNIDLRPDEKDLKLSVKDYNLDETIKEVNALGVEALKTGKKLGLFIGRTAAEALPREEVEKNIFWVSLDVDMGNVPLANRIHLKMDFNDENSMKKISNFFDKVVMDLSVLKFFKDDDPWRKLGRLLKKDPEATLITEADRGMLLFSHKGEKAEDKYYNGVIQLTFEERNEKDLYDKAVKKAYLGIKNYLNTLFSNVAFVEGKTFPYKSTYSNENNLHFILKGPKYPEITYFKFQQEAIAEKNKKRLAS